MQFSVSLCYFTPLMLSCFGLSSAGGEKTPVITGHDICQTTMTPSEGTSKSLQEIWTRVHVNQDFKGSVTGYKKLSQDLSSSTVVHSLSLSRIFAS